MLVTFADTNPRLVLDANPKRVKLDIQMEAQSVNASNSGRVHIGFSFQPIATVGHTQQGLILVQASGILEPSTDRPLSDLYKGAVWATSSAASQTIVVEEETE